MRAGRTRRSARVAGVGRGLCGLDEHLDRLRGSDRRISAAPAARIVAASAGTPQRSSIVPRRCITSAADARSETRPSARSSSASACSGPPASHASSAAATSRRPRASSSLDSSAARSSARPRPRTRSCASPAVPPARARRPPRRPRRATPPPGATRGDRRPARRRTRPPAPGGRPAAARTWHRRRASSGRADGETRRSPSNARTSPADLRRLECLRLDAERRGRLEDRRQAAGVVGRDEQQQSLRRRRQAARALQIDALDLRALGSGSGNAARPASCSALRRPDELDQRERIPARRSRPAGLAPRATASKSRARRAAPPPPRRRAPSLSSASPSASNRRASPSRAAKSSTTPSASSRRAANVSASADGRSSHCASSTTQTQRHLLSGLREKSENRHADQEAVLD